MANCLFLANLLFESKSVLSVKILKRHKSGLQGLQLHILSSFASLNQCVFKIWSTFQNEIIFNSNQKFATNNDVGLILTMFITCYFIAYGE